MAKHSSKGDEGSLGGGKIPSSPDEPMKADVPPPDDREVRPEVAEELPEERTLTGGRMKALRPAFLDIKTRNDDERARIESRIFTLERRLREDEGLDPESERELNRLRAIIPKGDPAESPKFAHVDPLFYALRSSLARTHPTVAQVEPPPGGVFKGELGRDERLVAAVYGVLMADNVTVNAPLVRVIGSDGAAELHVDFDDPRFDRAVAAALGEYGAHQALFDEVLRLVAKSGHRDDGTFVRANQWVNVVRTLVARSVTAAHPNLELLTRQALASEVAASDGAAPSSIQIDFPDLEATSDVLILKNNVLSMQIFYPAWMLEEAMFFDVYDKIEELFLNQLLPIGRGPAGDKIYARWKKSTQRIAKPERLTFYATCFGAPTGNPTLVNQNREFSDLWLRFLSAVSEFTRKLTVDDLIRSRTPLSVSAEQVRKTARDLAANLSLHGYGITYFAATELQAEINEIISILSDDEVRLAYGARDLWQLIEQVSVYELGKMVSTSPARTKATAGAVIIKWLADHAAALSGPYTTSILDLDVIRKPSMRAPGVKATQAPTDRDLVDACEQWLAVTGTSDDRVSEFAQPAEAPTTTSRPVQIPDVARNLLDSVGISAGYGGQGNGARLAGKR
jgi:hypothetical protein